MSTKKHYGNSSSNNKNHSGIKTKTENENNNCNNNNSGNCSSKSIEGDRKYTNGGGGGVGVGGVGRPNNSNNNRNKNTNLMDIERLSLFQRVREFAHGTEVELVLPGLSKGQRKELHNQAVRLGLKSRSQGAEDARIMHITRRLETISFKDAYKLEMSARTRQVLIDMLPTLRMHLLPSEDTEPISSERWRHEPFLCALGARVIPPRPGRISTQLMRDKQELPIYAYQDDILQLLRQHSVFIINGETGSGKSTQVPQYILHEAQRQKRPCRIVVTQPRRVAAVSVAQRVAEERGEKLGNAVGYTIRMESRIKRNTNLVYTTSGCLLRSIMSNVNELFQHVTHLIIDEIHERDKHTDFTLITLKEQLKRNRQLRVILMSATMDIVQLSAYFDNCPVLNVPGQGFDVKIYYLEDILFHAGYRTNLMERYYRTLAEVPELAAGVPFAELSLDEVVVLSDKHQQEMLDVLLEQCVNELGTEEVCEIFDQLQYYVESEGMPVDAAHTRSGVTPLMAACRANLPRYVEAFLLRGAKVARRDAAGYTALHYAALHADGHCTYFLEHNGTSVQKVQEDTEKQRLLYAYQQQFNDESDVDHDLILSLLEGLYRSSHPGAILVFLPGYNDIVQQRDLITSTLPAGTYRICIMHGQMDSQDQCEALQQLPVRKIILSTNIGQTSITIPDLAYIIDSGKVKMKTYDSVTESSQLVSVWISQSDANQRAGRAGRTQNGVCYRLFSQAKYKSMSQFCVPEFMRIPLTEICLYAKTLEKELDVRTFLSRALNPPSAMSVQNAVRKLKLLDIFDDEEHVTELGRHLVEIPLDVQLGKCLLFSIFLQCFETVLTIVAYHSIKDPYILPTDRTLQGQASFQRKALAGDSFSDQRGILELYKSYVAIRHQRRRARDFCAKNFLSPNSMELFCATRQQIRDLIMRKYSVSHVRSQEDWNMVRFCLVAGFYPNVAMLDRNKGVLVSGSDKQLTLHRTSALNPPGMKNLKNFMNNFPQDWLVYYEKAQLARMNSINMNTMVPPLMVALVAGREHVLYEEPKKSESVAGAQLPEQEVQTSVTNLITNALTDLSLESPELNGKAMLSLDNWIKFKLPLDNAHFLLAMRAFLQARFLDFLRRGHNSCTSTATMCVRVLLETLEEPVTREEQKRQSALPSHVV